MRRRPFGDSATDPRVSWATYLGGSKADTTTAVALDACGNVYVAGFTNALDFPLRDPLQGALPSPQAAFIAKFDPQGGLLYSTYLGGRGLNTTAFGIAVDELEQPVVVGATDADDFPVHNAFQPTYGGGVDVFVSKLTASGDGLVYSTYLGGGGYERAKAVAVNAAGEAVVVGSVDDPDWPQVSPLRGPGADARDAFVAKLDSSGNVVYSTFYGGDGWDQGIAAAIDPAGNGFVAGWTESTDLPAVLAAQPSYRGGGDGFLAGLSVDGSRLLLATYLGGVDFEQIWDMTLDGAGNPIVVGETASSDFPTQRPFQAALNGNHDGFVAKVDSRIGVLLGSTYLGGSATTAPAEALKGVGVDSLGNVFVSGSTTSTDYPTTTPIQASNAGKQDICVTILDAALERVLFSTYYGGSEKDGAAGGDARDALRADEYGNWYVASKTYSSDIPVVDSFQPILADSAGDAFVFRVDGGVGGPVPGSVGNSLLAVKQLSGTEIHFTWLDIAVASSYSLRSGIAKGAGFPVLAGSSASGGVGVRIGVPVETKVFFAVVGANCGVEGPP